VVVELAVVVAAVVVMALGTFLAALPTPHRNH